MSEGHALVLVVAVWLGAVVAAPLPVSVGVIVVVGALGLARPWLLIIGGLLLSSALGARADAAYQPLAAATFDGEAELVTDAELRPYGARATIRLDDGSRLDLSVGIPDAFQLADAPAGSRVALVGRITTVEASNWNRSRHVVGSLQAESVAVTAGPAWWRWPSEVIRNAVTSSSRSFSPEAGALYRGLVIGDDRDQTLAQTARFRVAGLSHLLAVSGQNVAFALAVVWPLLIRLPTPGRLACLAVVLVVFALATRLEPSVVRASATAGVAAWATGLGRRATGVRTLSLAVSTLVLIDPFLVESVGFQLSVLATAGILLLGPALVSRLPGPKPVAAALGVSMAAQIGVAPLLIITFGPVSLTSLPANVLAGWAAGLVMVWGLSGGLVVAAFPMTGEVLQWPVGMLLWWIDLTSRLAVATPLPTVGLAELVGWLGVLVVGWLGWPHRVGRTFTAVLVGGGLWLGGQVPFGAGPVVGGGTVWTVDARPAVLVVAADADPRLVEALVESGVDHLDIVIFEQAGSVNRSLALALTDVTGAELVLAPPLHRLIGATAVRVPTVVSVDGGSLVVSPAGTRLEIDLRQ